MPRIPRTQLRLLTNDTISLKIPRGVMQSRLDLYQNSSTILKQRFLRTYQTSFFVVRKKIYVTILLYTDKIEGIRI